MEIDLTGDVAIEETNFQNVKCFITALSNSSWLVNADEIVIDDILNNAWRIQESFRTGESPDFQRELTAIHPDTDFSRILDLVMECIIKSGHLSEGLTLHAIKKYCTLSPVNNLDKVLQSILTEIRVRDNLTNLFERLSCETAQVNWSRINALLDDLSSGQDDSCMLNALRGDTQTLLHAMTHANEPNAGCLVQKAIDCLDSQSDLKIWFRLMREDNVKLVMDLCLKHSTFLNAVLRFFDQFADEVETNYDEDLNSKYSHLNLDFDEFVDLFKLFLSDKNFEKTIRKYLENNVLMEDNELRPSCHIADSSIPDNLSHPENIHLSVCLIFDSKFENEEEFNNF